MSLAGAGIGAAQGLGLLKQLLMRQQALDQDQQQAEMMLAQRQREAEMDAAAQAEDRTLRARQIDLADTARRGNQNTQQLELMNEQAALMAQNEGLKNLPPHLRQLVDVRRVAGNNIRPEDLQTPEERAAAEQAKEDATVRMAGRVADAQAAAREKYEDKPVPDSNKAPTIGVAAADKVAAATTSLDVLDRLQSLYSDDKVGPIAGRYNTMERGAPSVLGAVMPDAPEGFEEFAAESATLKNQIIQAVTGAAVSAQEQTRILQQIPQVQDTPANWKAKAAATRRNLEALRSNIVAGPQGAMEPRGATVPATAPKKFTILKVQ